MEAVSALKSIAEALEAKSQNGGDGVAILSSGVGCSPDTCTANRTAGAADWHAAPWAPQVPGKHGSVSQVPTRFVPASEVPGGHSQWLGGHAAFDIASLCVGGAESALQGKTVGEGGGHLVGRPTPAACSSRPGSRLPGDSTWILPPQGASLDAGEPKMAAAGPVGHAVQMPNAPAKEVGRGERPASQQSRMSDVHGILKRNNSKLSMLERIRTASGKLDADTLEEFLRKYVAGDRSDVGSQGHRGDDGNSGRDERTAPQGVKLGHQTSDTFTVASSLAQIDEKSGSDAGSEPGSEPAAHPDPLLATPRESSVIATASVLSAAGGQAPSTSERSDAKAGVTRSKRPSSVPPGISGARQTPLVDDGDTLDIEMRKLTRRHSSRSTVSLGIRSDRSLVTDTRWLAAL
ncbi:unnamed protein product [Ostreobium quekettii]|uniref:Uncharacterized protein n=1 Tax=Ostreobium quekettii TaxID=121088 RepID=A0A8S1IT94_9CHLO|nr:unnamed protein product [Ostreobium quekettii]